jgi:hypothetical protein
MGALIASGRELATSCIVKRWRDTGLHFPVARKRHETRHLVHHWTGGSRPGPQVFQQLQARKLSVHLCVDPDGVVWQYCDLDRRCSHAGTLDDSDGNGHELSANAYSVGIEAVNPAIPKVPTGGAPRAVVREVIHGHAANATTFTAAQMRSLLELTQVICAHYDLPLDVPRDPDGAVLTRVLSEPEFESFRGVLGHYMLTRRKRDPGLALMRAVAALPLRGKDGAAE